MTGSGVSLEDARAVWFVWNQGKPVLIRRNPCIWSDREPFRCSCCHRPITIGLELILISHGESSGNHRGVLQFIPKVTWSWHLPKGTCATGQAGFLFPCCWLRSCTLLDWNPCCVPLTSDPNIEWRVLWGLWVCLPTCAQGDLELASTRRPVFFFFFG